jgi:hypothetical protein
MGHKGEAQRTQVTVSGIGEPEPRDSLTAHGKVDIKPMHDMDAADSTPKVGAQRPAYNTALGPPVDVEHSAPEDAPDFEAPAAEAAHTEPVVSSEPGDKPSQPTHDALAALAMEPDAPEPTAPEPEQPTPAVAESPESDPLHDAAAPSLTGQVVVSHHSMISDGPWKLISLLVLVFLFALLVLDILMDVGVISTSVIPHTNLF